jgi:hypothetical protein
MMPVPLAVPIVDAPSPSPSATPSDGATAGSAGGSGSGLQALSVSDAMWFVSLTTLVLVLLLVAATIFDLWYANRVYKERLAIIKGLVHSPATEAETKLWLTALGRPVSGVQGLTRSLIAFSILAALVLALTAVFTSSATDAAELRKTLVTSLVSVFATIVGFYFGSRTAQTSADNEARRSGEGGSSSGAPKAPRPETAVAGSPTGRFLPEGASPPADLAALRASKIKAEPGVPWTKGENVKLSDGSMAYWDGTGWKGGEAP